MTRETHLNSSNITSNDEEIQNAEELDSVVISDSSSEKINDETQSLLHDEHLSEKISKTKAISKRHRSYVRRLVNLALQEKFFLSFGVIALLAANATLLAIPLYVGKIVDATSTANESEQQKSDAVSSLTKSVIVLIIIGTLSAAFSTVRAFLFTVAGESIVTKLRKQLFSSIVTQEIAFFDVTKTGELTNRLSSDCVGHHFTKIDA